MVTEPAKKIRRADEDDFDVKRIKVEIGDKVKLEKTDIK